MLDTCIILNGPPNCGKDTIADLITNYGYKKHMMKGVLYSETAKYFGIYRTELLLKATDRVLKETPWEKLPLDGMYLTPREALIHVSEDVIKPQYGEEYFGKKAAEECQVDGYPKVVFSDGGFEAEVGRMQAVFKHTFIFQLQREGCDWGSDSRTYLDGFVNTHRIVLVDDKPWLAVSDILSIVTKDQGDS